jgi:hypothetical protein
MFFLLGSVLAIFGEGWLVLGIPARLLGLGLIVLGFGEAAFWAYRALRRREQLPQEFTHVTGIAGQTQLRRHVALRPDGRGVTFYLEKDDRGQLRWTWTYDEGVAPGQSAQNPGVLHTIDQAIFKMNEYLGLPHHPSSPPWAKEAPGDNLPGWPWDPAREAEPGWPWDPARQAEPGWPWDPARQAEPGWPWDPARQAEPGWSWGPAREAEPGWPWDPARQAEPGWSWGPAREADEAEPSNDEKHEASPSKQASRARFYGQVDLECGDSITVLALHAPKTGDIRRCPRCRVDRAVTHILP